MLRQRATSDYNTALQNVTNGFDNVTIRSRCSSTKIVTEEIKKHSRIGSGFFARVKSSLGLSTKPDKVKNDVSACADDADDVFSSVSVVEKAPEVPDYRAMGAFHNDTEFSVHPELVNDIVHVLLHKQGISEENVTASWHNLGGDRVYVKVIRYLYEVFRERPLATETLYLAFYYLNAAISLIPVKIEDLGSVVLASYNLASKMDRQKPLSRHFFDDCIAEVYHFEKKICRCLDFQLNKATVIDFMRMLQSLAFGDNIANWNVAKCLAEIAMMHTFFITLRPALLAGVVVKLACIMVKGKWTHECFLILNVNPMEFSTPVSLLCRLLLVAKDNPNTYSPMLAYKPLVSKLISKHHEMLSTEATNASNFTVIHG